MVKMVKARTAENDRWLILVPDASFSSYLKRKRGFSYLKLFSAVAINEIAKGRIDVRQNNIARDGIIKILLGIDQQMASLHTTGKQADVAFYKLRTKVETRNVMLYTKQERFITFYSSFLNSIYALKELTIKIDRLFRVKYSNLFLWDRENIKNLILIRHLLMHEGVPLVSRRQNGFVLNFSKSSVNCTTAAPLLEKAKSQNSNNVDFMFPRPVVHHLMINASMNTWAKKHLDNFDPNTNVKIITRILSDGRIVDRPFQLSKLISMANTAPRWIPNIPSS